MAVPGGGAEYCGSEMKSTCRLISVIPECTHELPFIIFSGCCPATCQIGCPTPCKQVGGRISDVSLTLNVFCIFVILLHPDKTVKLWKISERDKRPEGYNLKDEDGRFRDPSTITTLRVRGHRKLSGPTASHTCAVKCSTDVSGWCKIPQFPQMAKIHDMN